MKISARVAFAVLCFAVSLPPAFGADTNVFVLRKRQPHGPSFDCTVAALTIVERRICRSSALSRLDLKLSDVYADDVFDSSHALRVMADEAAWIAERNQCAAVDCLAGAYSRRLAEVRQEHVANEAWEDSEVRADYAAYAAYAVHPASHSLAARLEKMAGTRCFQVDRQVDAGDGRASLLAHTCGPCYPSDEFIIFHPENGTYRILLRAHQCYVSGTFGGFQEERSHGLRRIITFSRGGADDHYEDFYDYDGRTYRHTVEIEEIGAGDGHERTRLVPI